MALTGFLSSKDLANIPFNVYLILFSLLNGTAFLPRIIIPLAYARALTVQQFSSLLTQQWTVERFLELLFGTVVMALGISL